jgi:hypothetical protein
MKRSKTLRQRWVEFGGIIGILKIGIVGILGGIF